MEMRWKLKTTLLLGFFIVLVALDVNGGVTKECLLKYFVGIDEFLAP